jgi:exonuclease SbcD
MRILHTSDWHLGQTLHQFDRQYEHTCFLDWLLQTLVTEQVDALIIPGDVFDNANPSAATQKQLYKFLTDARERVPHLNIVMTAGNHDSPGRLEAPGPFLALINACVIGQVGQFGRVDASADIDRLVVPLKRQDGSIAAWCIAMPFLRTSDVPRVEGAEDAFDAGVRVLYASAFDIASRKRAPDQAIVALGHCHVSGGKVSESSERNLLIGGAQALSSGIFAPQIAYVALGHLHLAQQVGGDTTRRYCGSPMPMSFAEINYPHQVVIVDLAGDKVETIRLLAVPLSVVLMRVPKQPAVLKDVLAALDALVLADCEEAAWPYLQVRVLLTQPEPGLRAQIDAALFGKPVRLARIETSYNKALFPDVAAAVSIDDLNALAPAEFFSNLYQHRYAEAPPPDLLAAFHELLNGSPDDVKAAL